MRKDERVKGKENGERENFQGRLPGKRSGNMGKDRTYQGDLPGRCGKEIEDEGYKRCLGGRQDKDTVRTIDSQTIPPAFPYTVFRGIQRQFVQECPCHTDHIQACR